MKREKIGNLLLKFRRSVKIPADQYLDNGDTPVIDQSTSSWIAGYTNDPEARHESPLPITVFGDHTRVVKFVNFPFASGADGTQLLYPNTARIDPTYFYYAIRNVDLSNYFYARHFKFLKEEEISIPSLERQQAIAETLSAYDDLIENNRRRIALLEESARLLYREWFVRLRFPGHEHTRIVNGVPEGWRKSPLSELTSFLKRGVTPRYDDEAEGLVINQKCIRNGQVNMNLARKQSREFAAERQILVGDVLINSTGEGTLGRVAQFKTAIENCTVDTHVTIVRPNSLIPMHYFGIAVMDLEPKFSTMGRGATNQTELSPTAIGEVKITIPSTLLMEQFDLLVEPISEQVTNLTTQNQKLRTARDLLLPKLMSGEIEL